MREISEVDDYYHYNLLEINNTRYPKNSNTVSNMVKFIKTIKCIVEANAHNEIFPNEALFLSFINMNNYLTMIYRTFLYQFITN